MWPDRVSNPGPLTYESGALPTALRGPARKIREGLFSIPRHNKSLSTHLPNMYLLPETVADKSFRKNIGLNAWKEKWTNAGKNK